MDSIKTILYSSLLIVFCWLQTSTVQAEVSTEEAGRLGQDLTPLGGEKAGNSDGSIPAWEGGITEPPAGYTRGKHYVDPFAADQPLLTITAGNMGDYADKLSEGHKALLTTYPDTYKMQVYPTRRSTSTMPPVKRPLAPGCPKTATVSAVWPWAFLFLSRKMATRLSGITCSGIAGKTFTGNMHKWRRHAVAITHWCR